jgi:hypothetical protein
VAQTACSRCLERPVTEPCDACGTRCERCDRWDSKLKTFTMPPCPGGSCGSREFIAEGDDTNNTFGEWLFQSQHKDSTVLAHNMKG